MAKWSHNNFAKNTSQVDEGALMGVFGALSRIRLLPSNTMAGKIRALRELASDYTSKVHALLDDQDTYPTNGN